MTLSDSHITIAPAGWHDFGPVRQLEEICFTADAWPFWDILGALTLPQIVRLKAVAEDKLVGFIAVDVRQRKGEGWIMTIGVLPEFRRRRVASALIDKAESLSGMSSIRLHVRQSNLSARQLYKGLGYSEYDRWPRYYTDGEDAVLMFKTLRDGTAVPKGL
ncbi:MAG TPA: N-acetyltransferase [Anaerolineales bacterium]|nr:N-acetyltransferase [Anaerolineales bacterium]